MKFIPRHDQIVGRTAIKKTAERLITLANETAVTKFVIVDGVGPDAEAADIKVGDLILPLAVSMVVMEGGVRPILKEQNVGHMVHLEPGETLCVQTENGQKFVPMDSPDAAKSLGHSDAP